jgi:CRP-like cAMP-binding protein
MTSNKAPLFSTRTLGPGKVIFREGQDSDAAYLIKQGKVKVTRTQGEKVIVLDIVSAPEVFGEMAFINKEPRSATVETLEETELIIITHDQLEQYLDQTPVIVKALVHCLSQRLRTTTAFVQHQGSDNNLTSACYCLSLMRPSYPTDSSQNSKELLIDSERAVNHISRSLGIPEKAGRKLLLRINELGLISLIQHRGKETVLIADTNQLQTEARKLNRPTPLEDTYDQKLGYLDVTELAHLLGTEPNKIKRKVGTGEIPDRLIYFNKRELFRWIDEL